MKNNIDLDEIVKEFTSFEQTVEKLARENTDCAKRSQRFQKQLEISVRGDLHRQEQIRQLEELSTTLQGGLQRALAFEEENKALLEKNEDLKTSLNHLRESLDALKLAAEANARKLEEGNHDRISQLEEQHKKTLRCEVEKLNSMLEKKQKETEQTIDEMKSRLEAKDLEIVKLKLDKDRQTATANNTQQQQQQQSRLAVQAPSRQDIFRKKLQFVRAEASREITQLKQRIADLEGQKHIQSHK